ncbi:inositol polyphosphate 5-phosphatase OCRL-1-like protein [Dinothrombium tinctorium]|uniref:phosphoinositide 5-phosphatase n=1 Tax=Dinothrombium tinctorium TaxID=1965070 RepID=A0A3S3NTB4_9ACAR|nr:inositol polyphosphate 5-phosphatase OCRL-1-like protein [Dinothrombium tinctorium]
MSLFYVSDCILRDSLAMDATPVVARERVSRQMAMHEEQYTDLKPFRIFIGSWNVNGQSASVSLGEYWLASDPTPPDIYAIGFQELDLSKEAFLFNETPREEEWLQACVHGLHPNATYVKIKLVRLIGMMLIVFIKKELEEYVTNVAAETVGTGVLGKMGNKGGVSVRFDFHNTSICFVNCHLAAHVEEFERRNQDYHDICNRMVFNQFKPPKFIKDHDQIYWFGDLNYRLTDLSTDSVIKLLEAKEYHLLLQHDQLKIQHNAMKVFVGFNEGEIRHKPTYKYDPGTDNWDSSEKNRPPAWCDRVLWRGGPMKLIQYRSHPKLKISDHKPVSALFDASIKVVDSIKYRKLYENVMKKLDYLENEFLPQVAVDKMEISFGSLSFRDCVTEFLTIANTGQVPVKFEFIKKPNHDSYCKEWLQIKPYTRMLMPGEKLDVELEVCVDIISASKLNAGIEKLYDILVLHLDGGKDLFITVSGTYKRSCFGCSINALTRMKLPVREISDQMFQDLQQNKNLEDYPQCWSIPKELWILVDQIFKFGMLQEDLFQQTGLHSEFQCIRDTLDSQFTEKLSGSVHSIAEALLLFLEALAEPVVPFNFYHRALESSNNFILCKQIISEINESHRHVFYHLIAFMRELLTHSNYNKLEQKLLATVFGEVMLRQSPEDQKSKTISVAAKQSTERKKQAFIHHFLINDFDV